MRKLPSVERAKFDSAGATRAFDQAREILETRFGKSAPLTERAVTYGDLFNAGIVSLRDGNGNLTTIGAPVGEVLPIPALPGDDRVPPAPTNVEAVAGLSTVVVTWSEPVADYIAYAEVYRAEEQNLSDAVKIGQTSAWVYADYAEGGRTYWYWVRWVSQGGKVGPFSLPASATLPLNPDYLLELLSGQVGESALTQEFASRVDLIDAPGTGLTEQYTVKVTSQGRVSGFGLATTPRDGVPVSEFVIVADRFAIVSPFSQGQTPKVPFVIGTVEGVTATVIANAFIADGAISRAKIGIAAIDDARIAELSAAKVTFGQMSGDRIAANTMTADRITAVSFAAAVANIGTAYVNTANIVNGAITTAKIGDAQIGRGQIADLAVNVAKIDDLSVSEFKLQNGSISSVKIREAAVQRAHIQDLAVTTAKIDDGQITHFKLGDGSIHSAKIQSAAIQTLHVAGNAITVPATFYADGVPGSGTAVELAAVYMNTEASPVTIVFSAILLENGVEDSFHAGYIDLRVNDGPVATMLVRGEPNTPVSFTRQIATGFGTTKISVTASGPNPFTRRCLTTIGTKR